LLEPRVLPMVSNVILETWLARVTSLVPYCYRYLPVCYLQAYRGDSELDAEKATQV
jgi:hypothetical protein